MKKLGYNLFNETDKFYTDICTVYTSENGTDMLLEDRKKEIFEKNGNKTLCQNGCQFLNYDSNQEKAECECSPQSEEVENLESYSNNKFDPRQILDNFYTTLKNSNFLVLKCYKLPFNFKNFGKNVGRIVMCIIILLHFITLIIFIFIDFKNINKYLVTILNIKLSLLKPLKEK